MVLKKILSQINLFGIQIICIYKAIKVVMIYENKHSIFVTFQIMTSYFESFNKS